MSYYVTIRAQDILRNVIVSGYVVFYEIDKYFAENLIYPSLTKCLHLSDKMASRA